MAFDLLEEGVDMDGAPVWARAWKLVVHRAAIAKAQKRVALPDKGECNSTDSRFMFVGIAVGGFEGMKKECATRNAKPR